MTYCQLDARSRLRASSGFLCFIVPVVKRNGKLTNGEISRISRKIGVDWDSLAGLMDIPYSEREKIRANQQRYPSFSSKAEQTFVLINESESFDRHNLGKCVEEFGRYDLKKEIIPVENEVFNIHIYQS